MVRKGRLELPRVAPLGPKPSASTNSATFAQNHPNKYYSEIPSGPDLVMPGVSATLTERINSETYLNHDSSASRATGNYADYREEIQISQFRTEYPGD